ncbi:hypothetical protein DMENIID0001_112110 [Sergentomyia squamirostris]
MDDGWSQKEKSVILSVTPVSTVDTTMTKSFRTDQNIYFDLTIPLREKLMTTPRGKDVLDLYTEHKALDSSAKSQLTHEIVDPYVFGGRKMTVTDYMHYASEIEKTFPNEEKELYYIQASDGHRARGKLLDRYDNQKRRSSSRRKKMKNINMAQPSHVPAIDDLEDDDESNVNLKQSLMDGDLPWDTVINYWLKTCKRRMLDLKKTKSLTSFFEDWPKCLEPQGYELIFLDFEIQHPLVKDNLEQFDSFAEKILLIYVNELKVARCKELLDLILKKKVDNDCFDCIIMLLLHGILQPPRMANRKLPTILDAQTDFVHFVQTISNLEPEIETIQEDCLRNKTTIQPTIFVVGSDDVVKFKTEAFYVFFNGIKYRVPSFRVAVEIVVKLCVVFNVKYSHLSKFAWIFIQEFCYCIKCESFPKVRDLVKRVRNA